MSGNRQQRYPISATPRVWWNTAPGTGVLQGGNWTWDNAATASTAFWTLDDAGKNRATCWDSNESANTVAAFASTQTKLDHWGTDYIVSAPDTVKVGALEFYASLKPHKLSGQGPIQLPNGGYILVDAGLVRYIECQLGSQTGSAIALEKRGAGEIQLANTVPSLSTLTVTAGMVRAIGVSALSACASAMNLSVAAGATLRFVSSANVYLTGVLTGAGTVAIEGGGHLVYRGWDVGSRPTQSISGWTGTFVSPLVNHAPVITGGGGSATAYVSQQKTIAVTATDSDGDAMTLSIRSAPSGVSVSGMNLLYTPTAEGASTIQYRVTDSYGAYADSQVSVTVQQPYDVYVDQFAAGPIFGPTTATPAAYPYYRIGYASGIGGVSAGYTGSHVKTVFSGSGHISVLTEASNGPMATFSGDSATFSGTIEVADTMKFGICGNPTGSGIGFPLYWSRNTAPNASLGTAFVRLGSQGAMYIQGLPAAYSTLNFSIYGGSGNAVAYFGAGTYQFNGTCYVSEFHLDGDTLITFAQMPQVWKFVPALSTSAPAATRLYLPSNPVFGSSGIRHFSFNSFGAVGGGYLAGTYTVASWSGTASGVPELYEHYYGTLPGIVKTTEGANTVWTRNGKRLVFTPSGSLTIQL